MKPDELQLIDYLSHIAEAANNVHEYLDGLDYASFIAHKMAQDAVIRNFEIIGEAAKKILEHFPDFAKQHNTVPWRALYGMRNALSHGYFKVDLERVWQTAERDLKVLNEQVHTILDDL